MLPKIVSLFSGAGGLDLGFKSVGFPLSVAIDRSAAAIETHRKNFPATSSLAADLIALGPDGVLAVVERAIDVGQSIGVIGGPPCQGFSRANTASTPEDPRNQLTMLYLQIVERLQEKYRVEFVLFENVKGIRDSKHARTFGSLLEKFESLGLCASVLECLALDYGVPQARRRVIISGFRLQENLLSFAPKKSSQDGLTVGSTIKGLPEPTFFSHAMKHEEIAHHPNHWTMRPRSKRFEELSEHRPSSRSFRRLEWDKPSPTVAYGHREIHVHPDGRRRLSIYEAMLLQGFPESFVLKGNFSEQVEQVSNAVPPPLAQSLALAVRSSLKPKPTRCLPAAIETRPASSGYRASSRVS